MIYIIIPLLFSVLFSQIPQFTLFPGVPSNLDKTHQLYLLGNTGIDHYQLTDHPNQACSDVQIGVEHPYTFRENFSVIINTQSGEFNLWDDQGNFYGLSRLRLDLNGDGNWEVGWTNNAIVTSTFTYPPIDNEYYEEAVIILELEYSSILGETFTLHREIPITIYPDPEVYATPEGDNLVRLRPDLGPGRSPVLLVEGFDPLNKYYPSTYFHLLYNSLHEELPLDEYDLTILNFSDGGGDMRSNAEVVRGALNQISEYNPGENTIAIGFSMGGVVTRYALAAAEAEGVNHNVHLFISLDAPQQGANVNFTLQQVIYQLNPNLFDFVDHFQTMLSSVAARQLLMQNIYDPPLLDGHGSEFNAFFDELNQLNGDGYPHLSTNIAISNGELSSAYPVDMLGDPLVTLNTEILGESNTESQIPCSAFDIGPGSLKADFQGTFWNEFDLGIVELWDITLTCHFDPVFIPTWSALDLQEVVFTDQLSITSFESSGFDFIFSQTETGYHADLNALTIAFLSQNMEEPPAGIYISNHYNGSNMEGTFLGILETGQWVPSGSHVELAACSTYTTFPEYTLYPDLDCKFRYWNSNPQDYFWRHSFSGTGYHRTEIAHFEMIHDLTVHIPIPIEVEFLNPWHIDPDGSQPAEFRPLSSSTNADGYLQVFAEAGMADLILMPYYSLRTQSHYHDEVTGKSWRFRRWKMTTAEGDSDDQSALAIILDPENWQNTPIIFREALSDYEVPPVLKAEYDSTITLFFSAPADVVCRLDNVWSYDEDLESWSNSMVELFNGAYSVFPDTFSISAPRYVINDEQLWEFNTWQGSGVNIDEPAARSTEFTILNDGAQLGPIYLPSAKNLLALDSLIISENDWLTMPAGTQINFLDDGFLEVAGSLTLQGTEQQPVTWSAPDLLDGFNILLTGDFSGYNVNWENADQIICEYDFQLGSFNLSDFNISGFNEINIQSGEEPQQRFSNGSIINGGQISISDGAHVDMQSVALYDFDSILMSMDAELSLTNCEISAGQSSLIQVDEAHLEMNNVAVNGLSTGIIVTSGRFELNSCRLIGADGSGYGVFNTGGYGLIERTEISRFSTGFWSDMSAVTTSRDVYLDFCTIAQCDTGIFWNGAPLDAHNHSNTDLSVQNSILYTQHSPLELNEHDGDLLYNFAHSTDGPHDPMFSDPEMGDLHLNWGSPCIDAGDPLLTDIDYSRADQGAWSYHQMVGDVMVDGVLDLLDVTQMVLFIQTDHPLTSNQLHCADTNFDGTVDILDIIAVVDCILENCISMGDVHLDLNLSLYGTIWVDMGDLYRGGNSIQRIYMSTEESVRGFQMELYWNDNVSVDSLALSEDVAQLELRYEFLENSGVRVIAYPLDDFLLPAGTHAVIELFGQELTRTIGENEWQITKGLAGGGGGVRMPLTAPEIISYTTPELNILGPNPFNASTLFKVTLPETGKVKISIHNLLGQEVEHVLPRGSELTSGEHLFVWDAANQPTGIYFVRLDWGSSIITRKLLLVK